MRASEEVGGEVEVELAQEAHRQTDLERLGALGLEVVNRIGIVLANFQFLPVCPES